MRMSNFVVGVLLLSFFSRDETQCLIEGKVFRQTPCGQRQNCQGCIEEVWGGTECLWCAAAGKCVDAADVYEPGLGSSVGPNDTEKAACAGVISNSHRCAIDTSDYRYLLKRPGPKLHSAITSMSIVTDDSTLPAGVNLNWPVDGTRVHNCSLPANLQLSVASGYDDLPGKSLLCAEVALVGQVYLNKSVETICRPIDQVESPRFAQEGIYIVRIWLTVEPEATDAASGGRVSNVATVTVDNLRSEFYEDSTFSLSERADGFPFDTWADKTSATKSLRDMLISSNVKYFSNSVPSTEPTGDRAPRVAKRRHFRQWGHRIPRIIHQIWWQGEQDLVDRSKKVHDESMYDHPDWRSANFLKWSKSWRTHHPDWSYRLWTESSIASFVEESFPHFKTFFFSLDSKIKKIDFARYLIMFVHGGVYVDMDFEAFRPIDPLVFSSNKGKGPGVFLAEEAATKTINCAVLGSIPRHPFFWIVIHEVMRRELERSVQGKSPLGVLYSTGPQMLTNMVAVYRMLYPRADIRVLDFHRDETKWLYPFNADDLGKGVREASSYACTATESCGSLHRNSFAMHHFSGSWWPEYEKYLNDLSEERRKSQADEQ